MALSGSGHLFCFRLWGQCIFRLLALSEPHAWVLCGLLLQSGLGLLALPSLRQETVSAGSGLRSSPPGGLDSALVSALCFLIP